MSGRSADYRCRRIRTVSCWCRAVLASHCLRRARFLLTVSVALAGHHPAQNGRAVQHDRHRAEPIQHTYWRRSSTTRSLKSRSHSLLAILSWALIERPFRSGPLRMSRRPLFAFAGTMMFVLVAFSSLTIFAKGFQGRFPSQVVEIASYPYGDDNRRAMQVGTCFITSSDRFEHYDHGTCLHRDARKPTYLLLGDSHSAALWHGLSSSLPDTTIMQASASGCAPVLDTAHAVRSSDCRKMMNFVFDVYLPRASSARAIVGSTLAVTPISTELLEPSIGPGSIRCR